MSKTLDEVFDEHLGHLKFNQALATELYRFQVRFVNKNEEHMAFFGGKLLGVHVVRFSDQDFTNFFDIIDIDPDKITHEIVHHIPEIKGTWKVTNDVLSMTTMYLIHKFLTTNLMSEEKRERVALDIALIFNYRWIAALIRDYFRFPADPKLAQATYANLSNRYLIKRLNSWQEVLTYRANEMLGKESIHRNTLLKFNNNSDIIYCVNDSQGRIRDMVKNIYGEMVATRDSGERIHINSGTTIDTDGVDVIKDRIHGLEIYTNYILSVILDKDSFIKQELTQVIVKVMHTMQERGFKRVLEWISNNAGTSPQVEEFVRLVLVHSFNYLSEHGSVLKNTKDLSGMLAKLKGIYNSSRSSDEDLLKLRDIGTKIVYDSIGKTNEQTVAAIRTGVMLYICLRTYTKHYYGG